MHFPGPCRLYHFPSQMWKERIWLFSSHRCTWLANPQPYHRKPTNRSDSFCSRWHLQQRCILGWVVCTIWTEGPLWTIIWNLHQDLSILRVILRMNFIFLFSPSALLCRIDGFISSTIIGILSCLPRTLCRSRLGLHLPFWSCPNSSLPRFYPPSTVWPSETRAHTSNPVAGLGEGQSPAPRVRPWVPSTPTSPPKWTNFWRDRPWQLISRSRRQWRLDWWQVVCYRLSWPATPLWIGSSSSCTWAGNTTAGPLSYSNCQRRARSSFRSLPGLNCHQSRLGSTHLSLFSFSTFVLPFFISARSGSLGRCFFLSWCGSKYEVQKLIGFSPQWAIRRLEWCLPPWFRAYLPPPLHCWEFFPACSSGLQLPCSILKNVEF